MSKIVDITRLVPKSSKCEISHGSVIVDRLSVGDLAAIMLRFPKISEIFNSSGGRLDLTILAGSVPEALPFMIAMGLPEKERALEGVKSLDAADQILLLNSVLENSFPRGLQSFLDAVMTAAKGVNAKSHV